VIIPSGVTIGFDAAADAKRFVVSEKGVVVVPKGYQFDLAALGQESIPALRG
jgi:glucose-1-phosphate adenylyltransferase